MSEVRKVVVLGLLVLSAFLLSSCVGKDGKDGKAVPSHQERAFDKIMAYAQNGEREPDRQDYMDAGLVNLIEEKVGLMNDEIRSLTPGDVDALVELIAIEEKINLPPSIVVNSSASGVINKRISISAVVNDLDGNVVKYEWSINNEIDASHIAEVFSYIPDDLVTDEVTLTVTDEKGAKAAETIHIHVSADNKPTAEAGEDRTVTRGETVALHGVGWDEEGEVVYRWSKGEKLLAETAEYEYTPKEVGEHKLTFTVTDDAEQIGKDEIIITAVAKPEVVPNKPPQANAGLDREVIVGKTIQIVGVGSDSDGTIERYTWRERQTILSNNDVLKYEAKSIGLHTLVLEVIDDDGGKAEDVVNITVVKEIVIEPKNLIAKAGNDVTVEVGEEFVLEALVENNIGSIVYEWKNGGAVVSSKARFKYHFESEGQFTINLKVIDSDERMAEDSLDITVNKKVISDEILPVIELDNVFVEIKQGSSYIDSGYTASDNIDGDISDDIVRVISPPLNTGAAIGTLFVIKYNVVDSSGNEAIEVNRTIKIVAANNLPIITLKGPVNINHYKGRPYNGLEYYASKNLFDDLSYKVEVGGDTVNPNAAVNTVFSISYDVTDDDGNKALTKYRYVKIVKEGSKLVPTMAESDKEDLLAEVNALRKTGHACNDYKEVPALVWNDGLYGAAYEFAQDQLESGVGSLSEGSGTASDWTGGPSTPGDRNTRHGYNGGSSYLLTTPLYHRMKDVLDYFLISDSICRSLLNPGYTEFGTAAYFIPNGYYTYTVVIQVGGH